MRSLFTVLCAAAGLSSPVVAHASVSAAAPVGVITQTFPVGTTGLAFPLIAADAYTGVISASTSAAIGFSTSGLGALTAGDRYYLEIVSGPFEGERFDLDTAATIAAGATAVVDVASTLNTRAMPGPNTLAGARAVVRPHVTLAKVAAQFSPALVGNTNAARADGVQIHSASTGFVLYYLRPDGSWRVSGKTVDERNRVVPPDASVTLVLRSGAKQWLHQGVVRTSVFRKKLTTGVQSFASGFPVPVSPVQLGAATDALEPEGVRWVGNDAPALADKFQVLRDQSQAYDTYYLRGDGASWRLLSDPSADQRNQPVIPATGLTLLTRTKADADYVVIQPFAL